jgi:PiT family inorganic phosphate transporter
MSMSLAAAGLIALAAGVAFANGTNDISKGIATLVGSGVSNFRAAVLWGTVWTVAGGLLAAFVSQGLVATFSGKGFLNQPISGFAFLASVALGAAAWVLLASRTGLPVSTTHAIAGALAGAAIAAQGAGVLHWEAFARKIALPLALSPLVSVGLMYAVSPLLARAVSRAESYCICLERRAVLPIVSPGGAMTLSAIAVAPMAASGEACDQSPSVAARVSALDGLHWLSSALTSLARGLNDTPKIVALGAAASAALAIDGTSLYVLVALFIGAGSLIGGFRVTETLARKVTPMTPGEGFAANLVTTLLVGVASIFALPVSTTQVSSSAIIGIGLRRGGRGVHWAKVREMLFAWVVTLPASALVAGGAHALLSR